MPTKTRLLLILALLPALWFNAGCSDSDSKSDVSGASSTAVATGRVTGRVVIDFTGAPKAHDRVDAEFSIAEGGKALLAIKQALGGDAVQTKDFGGDLGVFITGFYGIVAEGNHFWEFIINGKSSDVGAGSYEVKNGDVLEFKYSSF